MPTLLKCTQCGGEVLLKETIVGGAKDLGKGKCVCETCLPNYDDKANPRPARAPRKHMWLAALALLGVGATVLLNTPIFRSSVPQDRTLWNKPKIREAFVNAVRNLPEEMRKSGTDTTDVPIRFPVGDRGARIEAYARMAINGQVEQISALLKKATDQPDVLREILSGISRSETPGFVRIVRPYLKHPTPEVRAISILAFGKVGGPENLPELKPLAQDPNPIVRAATQMATAALESAAE